MHFGTFVGSQQEITDALVELRDAVDADEEVVSLGEEQSSRFGHIDVGETWVVEL